MIDRKGTAAWLDNMGYPKLAEAIMDEKRFPDKVIYCKDCRYHMQLTAPGVKPIDRCVRFHYIEDPSTDYCSRAERRQDDR